MPNIDKILVCRECGLSFTFSAGEQTFYATRGLANAPSRCQSCRAARKNNGSSAIIDGYVHYGPFASFGGRSARQMHPATCTTCSQTTEVPFVPKDGRPVYCAECFGMMRRVTGDEHAAPRA